MTPHSMFEELCTPEMGAELAILLSIDDDRMSMGHIHSADTLRDLGFFDGNMSSLMSVSHVFPSIASHLEHYLVYQ